MTTVGMCKVEFNLKLKEFHFPAICLLHVLHCVVFTSAIPEKIHLYLSKEGFVLESAPLWKVHSAFYFPLKTKRYLEVPSPLQFTVIFHGEGMDDFLKSRASTVCTS